jgi:hypothetical protein
MANPFPNLNVYPDNFVGPLPLNGIKQNDFNSLNTSWNNIQDGHGMLITGTAAEKQIWNDMLTKGVQKSPTFRAIITSIGNNTDVMSRVEINLVSGDENVNIDNFSNKKVDLINLSNLSFNKSVAHPQQMTTGEAIVHFLSERLASVNDMMFLGIKTDLKSDMLDNYVDKNPELGKKTPDQWNDIGGDFARYHNYAISIQNLYREELGQAPVIAQWGDKSKQNIIQMLDSDSPPLETTQTNFQNVAPFDPSSSGNESLNVLDNANSPLSDSRINFLGINNEDEDETSNSPSNMLNTIRNNNAFDPAQHIGGSLSSINNTSSFGFDSPVNNFGYNINPVNNFGSNIDEGQITTAKFSFDNEENNFNTPANNFGGPGINETGFTSTNEFQNPVNTMSFESQNSFSSAGEMPSMEPATIEPIGEQETGMA